MRRSRVLDGLPSSVISVQQVAPGEEDDPSAWAELALDALFGMSGLVQPLSLEVRFACVDRELPVARGDDPAPRAPGLLLVREGLPDGVEASNVYVGARRVDVPRLDVKTAMGFVARGLEQPCPAGDGAARIATWTELRVGATQVRLPMPLEMTLEGAEEIGLADRAGIATVPLLRRGAEVWVAGPQRPSMLYAPLELHVGNDAGLLTFTVSTSWSIWVDRGPGLSDLRAAAARLAGDGWKEYGQAGVG